ncbi:MAG: hypothetical protein LAQ30_06050 [Acidobacteriia bacterium]|nr:hypothetical protein [Terriglobia bacterium]
MRQIGFCLLLVLSLSAADKKPAKAPAKAPAAPVAAPQKIDEAYTAKIREYTTEKFFSTELVDHLPASATVPAPDKVLGYVIGTPNKLTYSKDIYRYMRELEKASKRVRVFSIGKSEEGREMILVAVSDEANIAKLDRYREIAAKLADPRKTPPEEAAKLIDEGLPMYWATGSIHSTETGSPEMLTELAYRLAVEETPFIQNIRKNSIALITPLIEVDGHDREVDVYSYRKANPTKPAPPLAYWGKYVMHDNNRDGMGMGLALSRTMMSTFLDYHPTVLHDLHESVPFMYISTGMGPYNAWLDPIVVDEWQKMAWVDVEEMTKRGVPGIWTWGYYDGWAPNYMFYVANGHNSIGRFYETFGAGGADTGVRTVPPTQTTRTWYRPNPPLPRVNWSIRNNINLQQSGVLFAMNNVAANRKQFLENFYLKSKRSVEKAANEGPAAYVIPGDDPRPGECAEVVNLLKAQGVEVYRLSAETEVPVSGDKKQKFAAGSYVVRMDQPYSRMADMLLDTQYYNVNDAAPYDDTGWTVGALHNVTTVRIVKPDILKAAMTFVDGPAKPKGGIVGSASTAYLINHNADNTLATLRFALRDVKMLAAEDAFKADGRDFGIGSFVIKTEGNAAGLRSRLDQSLIGAGVTAYAVAEVPKVATHELAAPRIAFVHNWGSTQNEGWFRIAFDRLKIPYDYLSDVKLAAIPNLRDRYDVIVFGPMSGSSQRIVNGTPLRGDPVPYKGTEAMPNIGTSPDTADDTRGGLGLEGMVKIANFVDAGGLLVTITANASIPIDYGLIEGVSITPTQNLRARGSVLESVVADKKSPIAYGYGDKLAVYFSQAPVFQVSAMGGGFGGRGGGGGGGARGGRGTDVAGTEGAAPAPSRVTGRGSLAEPDIAQGRPAEMGAPPQPAGRGGAPQDELAAPMQRQQPPPELRPRVIVRFAPENELLVSGMLAGGRELANQPAVVDAPRGKGHILMFANNPMWRNQTQGSYFLLFNAMLNYNSLGVGRTEQPAPGRGARGGEDQ